MNHICPEREIERLLLFAEKNKLVEGLDIIIARNKLLDLFNIPEPFEGDMPSENLQSPAQILNNLLEYAAAQGLIKDDSPLSRDLFSARVMGHLVPGQSVIIDRFTRTYNEKGAREATDEFYLLSQASGYIQMDRIARNLYWTTATEYGHLEITINLSKPEKDPKEIAASKSMPQSSYPKCLLCLENIGFAGHINHPARQNHRVIPVTLGGEQWYFQYSPYVYYNEHCILFYKEHIPMKISEKTFERLMDFIELFPHYFIGSNADLPIVGGSILSHEHYQGGRHILPMAKAPIENYFVNEKYGDVTAGIVRWPVSVIRLSSINKESLIKLSIEIFHKWCEYSDPESGILASSEYDGIRTPHNTVTPIARKNVKGEFEIDLVLRNNRTDREHPEGIFHPHRELHHIKKENIGLIEVMGLAILPGRLDNELNEIAMVLAGNEDILNEAKGHVEHPLYKHIKWIEELLGKYGNRCSIDEAREILRKEVGSKFLEVLMDAGVYKKNSEGSKGFERFMHFAGFNNTTTIG